METFTHTLELPLNPELHQTRFRSFLKDLGSPTQFDFLAQYFRGRLKFSAANMPNADGNFGRTVSVLPAKELEILQIARFTSKLNVVYSINTQDRDISLELVEAEPNQIVFKATITLKTLAAEMALTNIWAVIDSSTR